MSKSFRLALLWMLLTACGSHPPRRVDAPPTPRAPPHSSSLAVGAYRVDPAHSEIRLLVYRAGPMAHLGHNHVIVNRAIAGTARVAPAAPGEAGAVSFMLVIPAREFVVDEQPARDEEGAEFAAEVSEEARSGTLRNMLSAELLDAARFSVIALESVTVADQQGVLTSTVAVNVAGHRSMVVVPFTVVGTGSTLVATGNLVLRQSALGLTPFRVMMGALAVQDEFTVKFKLVAVPA